MSNKQAHGPVVRIEIEWEDGLIRRATGADADEIHEYWVDLTLPREIHGGQYAGSPMVEVRPPQSSPGGPKGGPS